MKVRVEELRIDQTDLTTKRMFDLMAVNSEDAIPLYLHSVTRILRDLRIAQQQSERPFHYGEFKKLIEALDLTSGQKAPLTQRLDALESFMPIGQRAACERKPKPITRNSGTDWSVKVLRPPSPYPPGLRLCMFIVWLTFKSQESLPLLIFHARVLLRKLLAHFSICVSHCFSKSNLPRGK